MDMSRRRRATASLAFVRPAFVGLPAQQRLRPQRAGFRDDGTALTTDDARQGWVEHRSATPSTRTRPKGSQLGQSLQLGQPLSNNVPPRDPSSTKKQSDLQAAARFVGWSQGEDAAAAAREGVLEWARTAAGAPRAGTDRGRLFTTKGRDGPGAAQEVRCI